MDSLVTLMVTPQCLAPGTAVKFGILGKRRSGTAAWSFNKFINPALGIDDDGPWCIGCCGIKQGTHGAVQYLLVLLETKSPQNRRGSGCHLRVHMGVSMARNRRDMTSVPDLGFAVC